MKALQKRAELRRHAEERAKVLLPLCEEALGVKLKEPPKFTVVNKLTFKLDRAFYKAKEQFKVPLDVETPVIIEVALRVAKAFLLPLVYLGFDRLTSCYAHPLDNRIGLRVNGEREIGTPEFDYALAHEIVHLLIYSKIRGLGIFDFVYVDEGFATYYGEKVARAMHPEFGLAGKPFELDGAYGVGYRMVQDIARISGDDPWRVYTSTRRDYEANQAYLTRLSRQFSQPQMHTQA